jgi:hypothetical protein
MHAHEKVWIARAIAPEFVSRIIISAEGFMISGNFGMYLFVN